MNKEQRAIMKTLNQLDMIMIEWVDAECSSKSDGWKDIHESMPVNTKRVVVAQTIGFFVGFNRTFLRTSCNYDPSNKMITGIDDIPLTNIKGLYKLHVNQCNDLD